MQALVAAMVAMKGRVPAFVGLLIAMLARSSLPGARAAVVKVVTDAAAADPTVHFTSSPAYGSPPPSFDIVRSNSEYVWEGPDRLGV